MSIAIKRVAMFGWSVLMLMILIGLVALWFKLYADVRRTDPAESKTFGPVTTLSESAKRVEETKEQVGKETDKTVGGLLKALDESKKTLKEENQETSQDIDIQESGGSEINQSVPYSRMVVWRDAPHCIPAL